MMTPTGAIIRASYDCVFVRFLALPDLLSEKLWKVLQRREQTDGYARALLYAMRRSMAPDVDVCDAAAALFGGPLHPKKLVPWLDALADSGALTREDATTVQECILARTDKHSDWKDW